MSDRFKRALSVSTAVHVGVVVLVIVVPLLGRLFHPPKPKDLITFVDFMPASLPEPEPAPEVRPPEPEPQPEVPEPVPQAPARKPEKPKPEKPKINISTTRVVRAQAPAPPRKTTLTPAQIQKLLEQGVTRTTPGGSLGSSGEFSDLSIYYAQVRETMYGVWQQPSTAARGLSAEATIRVARNGVVLQRRLTRGSGSAVLDQSVQQAVNAVSRLKPLPPSVSDPHLDINIEFVVGDAM